MENIGILLEFFFPKWNEEKVENKERERVINGTGLLRESKGKNTSKMAGVIAYFGMEEERCFSENWLRYASITTLKLWSL